MWVILQTLTAPYHAARINCYESPLKELETLVTLSVNFTS